MFIILNISKSGNTNNGYKYMVFSLYLRSCTLLGLRLVLANKRSIKILSDEYDAFENDMIIKIEFD